MSELNSDVMVDEMMGAVMPGRPPGAGTGAPVPSLTHESQHSAAPDEGKLSAHGFTFEPENIYRPQGTALAVVAKPTVQDWFKAPAWSSGPPRWQVGLIGAGAATALVTVIAVFAKRK